jgi:hypothetical protein
MQTIRRFLVTSCLALLVGPAAPARAAQGSLDDGAGSAMGAALAKIKAAPAFYCDLSQMSKDERKRYDKIVAKLNFKQREFVEMEDGYSVHLPKGTVSLVELADFLTLEDKCCPFFSFTVDVEPAQASTTLKIRGPEGVKKFIKSVFTEGTAPIAK